MQKGFASLEIILAVMIILILATVVVPNAARLVDRAAVNYEQKRLYSELQFTRTLNRSANVPTSGMNQAVNFLPAEMRNNKPAELEIYRETNSYRIVRGDKIIREDYSLSNGVTFSNETNISAKISFDTSAYLTVKSGTIFLTSRRSDKKGIRIDSVGRICGKDKDD